MRYFVEKEWREKRERLSLLSAFYSLIFSQIRISRTDLGTFVQKLSYVTGLFSGVTYCVFKRHDDLEL
jgi:hypothetical protein